MANYLYNATALTGGTSGALDSYSVSALLDGDRAIVSDSGGLFVLEYDASSTDAESSPNIIVPDDRVSSGAWNLLSINQASDSPSSGVLVEGGVWGLDYSVTDTNEVTVTAGNCMSSDNSTFMSLTSSQTVDTSAVTTAGVAISLFLCSDGVVRYDEDETGVTLLSAYTKRWIGFVRNNSTGGLSTIYQKGNMMGFALASEGQLTAITSSFAAYDFSTLLPESRILAIEYGCENASQTNHIRASEDGTNISFYVGQTVSVSSDSSRNAFGDVTMQKTSLKPYNPDRQFAGGATSDYLSVQTVLMRR